MYPCMNKVSAFFLLVLLAGFSACKESPTTTSSSTDDDAAAPVAQQAPAFEAEIADRLKAYYISLEAEEVQEDLFFAPTVNSFFGKSLPREKVGESLRNGFKTVENRTLRIDPATLQIEQTTNGYVATFSGRVSFKRTEDGSEVHDMFHNQVTFNSDQLITAYESLPDPAKQQTESLRSAQASGPEALATQILGLIQAGKLTELYALCPDNLSPLLMVRSGAYSFPSQFSSGAELAERASWMAEGMSGLSTRITKGELPAFDCDDLFSKEGTYLGQTSGLYNDVSSLMKDIESADLDKYDAARYDAVKEVEKHVSHRVIDTQSGLSFCIGEVNGAWKLLVVDFASYDCSA